MSGRRSRNKGARGEREFFNELTQWLGDTFVRRNLNQTRDAGCDGETDLPVAIEVKRCETIQLTRWHRQAEGQAQGGEYPVLAYRRSRDQWRVHVQMSVPEFADWLRTIAPEKAFQLPGEDTDDT